MKYENCEIAYEIMCAGHPLTDKFGNNVPDWSELYEDGRTTWFNPEDKHQAFVIDLDKWYPISFYEYDDGWRKLDGYFTDIHFMGYDFDELCIIFMDVICKVMHIE